jgi:lysyl-tRNA synthetase class II
LRAKDYQEIKQEENKGGELNKKKRNEGVENLQLVEDQNLNLYRVRYSKHDLKKLIFKFDKELMP